MKQRLKSWAVWSSVLGALVVMLQALGILDKIGITSDALQVVITSIGTILVGFGILNNPTDPQHF